jgi:hypothetical protein
VSLPRPPTSSTEREPTVAALLREAVELEQPGGLSRSLSDPATPEQLFAAVHGA